MCLARPGSSRIDTSDTSPAWIGRSTATQSAPETARDELPGGQRRLRARIAPPQRRRCVWGGSAAGMRVAATVGTLPLLTADAGDGMLQPSILRRTRRQDEQLIEPVVFGSRVGAWAPGAAAHGVRSEVMRRDHREGWLRWLGLGWASGRAA